MKIIDITQEIFKCKIYPGDRGPKMIKEKRIANGELYNLSSFEMGAHNGTHLDAPYHFLNDGKTIDQLSLEKMVGWCYVSEYDGIMDKADAERIVLRVQKLNHEASKKLLFKGNAIISEFAAEVFAKNKLDLIGVELQSVGPEETPMKVHQILLKEEVCLLEGICLTDVDEGIYFLHAAPLLLTGFDGAPCRATLIQNLTKW